MKTLKTIILSAGAVAVLGASGLYAQSRATADIPFDFTVQNTTLPARTYTLWEPSAARSVVSIQNNETRKEFFVLAPVNASGYRRPQEKSVVVFHKVGDRYFLAEVKTDAVCGHVAPSKLERELSSEGGVQPMAAVIIPALSVR